MDKSSPRQRKILEMLKKHEFISISDIRKSLQVSLPTVYRDIRALAQAGLIERITGGIIPAQNSAIPPLPQRCSYCSMTTSLKTIVMIQLVDGEQITACCPHCGLLALEKHPQASSALATDFLYGNMVSIHMATFLLESQVTLCCAPSVLVFTKRDDAERFKLGFGGDILTFEQAKKSLKELMALHHPR